jgi:hypothetical protein
VKDMFHPRRITRAPVVYKVKVEAFRRHCGKVGRDYDEIVKSQLHLVTLADSDAVAREIVKRSGLCGMCDVRWPVPK